MKNLIKSYIVLTLLLLPALAWSYGEINVQNGNYKTAFSLIESPSDWGAELRLAYNSRSRHNGLFGYGWANNLETTFEILPSGNIAVTEYGGGYRILFTRKSSSKEELEKFNVKILAAMAKENPGFDREKMHELLSSDPNQREMLARKYGVKIRFEDIALGTTFIGHQLGAHKLQREAKGWSRIRADGSMDVFDSFGLIRIKRNAQNQSLHFEYDERNRLHSVRDDTGRSLTLTYNERGKVSRMKSPSRTFAFKYDSFDNLAAINEVILGEKKGARYEMAYDKLSNLARIQYPDGKIEKMKYDLQKDWIVAHEIGAVKTAYKYTFDSQNPHHYWISVIKTIGAGEKPRIIADKYEYLQEAREDGSLFNRKIGVIRDGVTTETTYARCCEGKPELIKRNGEQTQFEYYPDSGLLKRKTTPDQEVTFLFYEPQSQRISKIHHWMPLEGKASGYEYETTQFKYNGKGELIHALNHYRRAPGKLPLDEKGELRFPEKGTETKSIKLAYDAAGRMHHMEDDAGHTLTFQYNDRARPTSIALRGVGTVYVEYNEQGVISKIHSPQKGEEKGREIASSIIEIFQNLLDIIRPAGVDLSF